jgi:hypothetical protein
LRGRPRQQAGERKKEAALTAETDAIKDAWLEQEGSMTFGLSIADFTVLHVVISMLAIFAGFIVVGAMFAGANLGGWTAFFLIMTILTSLTGFLFPFKTVTPAIVVGVIASLILIVALWALYKHRLAGRWRVVYVVSAIVSLYLNVFVLVVQSFQKVSFLNPYAPTGSEPPFMIAQVATLVAFIILGWMAVRRFHPMRLVM